MARSFLFLAAASWLAGRAAAATVTHDFNITWVTRNPDNMMYRPVIGINNQWPVPVLNFTKGDTVIINANNQVSTAVTLCLLRERSRPVLGDSEAHGAPTTDLTSYDCVGTRVPHELLAEHNKYPCDTC